jgi:hypothetical protein
MDLWRLCAACWSDRHGIPGSAADGGPVRLVLDDQADSEAAA